jgi:hypothetical protein
MPVANYRSRAIFQAIQWDGTNEVEIAEWMEKDGITITVREARPEDSAQHRIAKPKQLVGMMPWGLMKVNVGDWITRAGRRSFDCFPGADFLKLNEEQTA